MLPSWASAGLRAARLGFVNRKADVVGGGRVGGLLVAGSLCRLKPALVCQICLTLQRRAECLQLGIARKHRQQP